MNIEFGLWYVIRHKNYPSVPDLVWKGVGGDQIRTADNVVVHIDQIRSWGYTVIPCHLSLIPNPDDTMLWSDKRLIDTAMNYATPWTKERVAETMQLVRDEYEVERKNKIFIPAELRGCLLLMVQKSKNFLVDMLTLVEEKVPPNTLVKSELDGWRAEIAEYDALLEAINGSQTSG